MRQYEIWWAELALPKGIRPVLLLSRDECYRHLASAVVVEIRSRGWGIPQELRLGSAEGLPRPSVAAFDNVGTIPLRALVSRIGTLPSSKIVAAKIALGRALAWTELTRLAT